MNKEKIKVLFNYYDYNDVLYRIDVINIKKEHYIKYYSNNNIIRCTCGYIIIEAI